VLGAMAIEAAAGTALVLVLVFGAGLLTALPQARDTPCLLLAGLVAAALLAGGGCAVVLLMRRRDRVALAHDPATVTSTGRGPRQRAAGGRRPVAWPTSSPAAIRKAGEGRRGRSRASAEGRAALDVRARAVTRGASSTHAQPESDLLPSRPRRHMLADMRGMVHRPVPHR
jgi:hypothetical protein